MAKPQRMSDLMYHVTEFGGAVVRTAGVIPVDLHVSAGSTRCTRGEGSVGRKPDVTIAKDREGDVTRVGLRYHHPAARDVSPLLQCLSRCCLPSRHRGQTPQVGPDGPNAVGVHDRISGPLEIWTRAARRMCELPSHFRNECLRNCDIALDLEVIPSILDHVPAKPQRYELGDQGIY